MKPIQLLPLSAEAVAELDHLYRTAPNMQVRTRAQMVLLSGEQGMIAIRLQPSCEKVSKQLDAG